MLLKKITKLDFNGSPIYGARSCALIATQVGNYYAKVTGIGLS